MINSLGHYSRGREQVVRDIRPSSVYPSHAEHVAALGAGNVELFVHFHIPASDHDSYGQIRRTACVASA